MNISLAMKGCSGAKMLRFEGHGEAYSNPNDGHSDRSWPIATCDRRRRSRTRDRRPNGNCHPRRTRDLNRIKYSRASDARLALWPVRGTELELTVLWIYNLRD